MSAGPLSTTGRPRQSRSLQVSWTAEGPPEGNVQNTCGCHSERSQLAGKVNNERGRGFGETPVTCDLWTDSWAVPLCASTKPHSTHGCYLLRMHEESPGNEFLLFIRLLIRPVEDLLQRGPRKYQRFVHYFITLKVQSIQSPTVWFLHFISLSSFSPFCSWRRRGPFLVTHALFYAGIPLALITDVLGPAGSECSYYYLPLASILDKTVWRENLLITSTGPTLVWSKRPLMSVVKGWALMTFKRANDI